MTKFPYLKIMELILIVVSFIDVEDKFLEGEQIILLVFWSSNFFIFLSYHDSMRFCYVIMLSRT